jgi:hypothetical protein
LFNIHFSILMINIFLSVDSTMNPPRKISQSTDKAPVEEASTSKIVEEEDIDTQGPIYDDTKGVIDKDTSLKWVNLSYV